jgi:hypothetical protein
MGWARVDHSGSVSALIDPGFAGRKNKVKSFAGSFCYIHDLGYIGSGKTTYYGKNGKGLRAF